MFATLPDVSPCLIHFLLVRPSLQEIPDVDLATLPRSSQPVVEEAPLHDLKHHVAAERRHVVLGEARVHPAADGLCVLADERTAVIPVGLLRGIGHETEREEAHSFLSLQSNRLKVEVSLDQLQGIGCAQRVEHAVHVVQRYGEVQALFIIQE